jgi:hypothetical protein
MSHKKQIDKPSSAVMGDIIDVSENFNIAGGDVTETENRTDPSNVDIKQLVEQIFSVIHRRAGISSEEKGE